MFTKVSVFVMFPDPGISPLTAEVTVGDQVYVTPVKPFETLLLFNCKANGTPEHISGVAGTPTGSGLIVTVTVNASPSHPVVVATGTTV